MTSGVYERTPEMKTGRTGGPLPPRTPEHCAALSDSMKNSKAAKAANDAKRGGNDFVWHHVAYDFGRPDALRVLITRKFHAKIHNPKGLGIHQRGYSLID